jgi:hypothetical protein
MTMFGYYSTGRNGERSWRCIRCAGEAVTRRHQKIRRILVEEHGGRCAICGYDRTPFNLHFHHVDPALKEFSLNSGTGKSLAACRAEAEKCVLVCANCHGEIESGLIESPPPGTRFGEIERPRPACESRVTSPHEQPTLPIGDHGAG